VHRQRGATFRPAEANTVVQEREHLVMPLDHGEDDGTQKGVELLFIHLKALPRLGEDLIPLVIRK
jgi:hypothetical protein